MIKQDSEEEKRLFGQFPLILSGWNSLSLNKALLDYVSNN